MSNNHGYFNRYIYESPNIVIVPTTVSSSNVSARPGTISSQIATGVNVIPRPQVVQGQANGLLLSENVSSIECLNPLYGLIPTPGINTQRNTGQKSSSKYISHNNLIDLSALNYNTTFKSNTDHSSKVEINKAKEIIGIVKHIETESNLEGTVRDSLCQNQACRFSDIKMKEMESKLNKKIISSNIICDKETRLMRPNEPSRTIKRKLNPKDFQLSKYDLKDKNECSPLNRKRKQLHAESESTAKRQKGTHNPLTEKYLNSLSGHSDKTDNALEKEYIKRKNEFGSHTLTDIQRSNLSPDALKRYLDYQRFLKTYYKNTCSRPKGYTRTDTLSGNNVKKSNEKPVSHSKIKPKKESCVKCYDNSKKSDTKSSTHTKEETIHYNRIKNVKKVCHTEATSSTETTKNIKDSRKKKLDSASEYHVKHTKITEQSNEKDSSLHKLKKIQERNEKNRRHTEIKNRKEKRCTKESEGISSMKVKKKSKNESRVNSAHIEKKERKHANIKSEIKERQTKERSDSSNTNVKYTTKSVLLERFKKRQNETDLRSILTNKRKLNKNCPQRENLLITLKQDVNTDQSKSTAKVTKKPIKTKKLRLVINIEFPKSDDTELSSNECETSPHQDLSFLDDFNVDEIVDSLDISQNDTEDNVSNVNMDISDDDCSSRISPVSQDKVIDIEDNFEDVKTRDQLCRPALILNDTHMKTCKEENLNALSENTEYNAKRSTTTPSDGRGDCNREKQDNHDNKNMIKNIVQPERIYDDDVYEVIDISEDPENTVLIIENDVTDFDFMDVKETSANSTNAESQRPVQNVKEEIICTENSIDSFETISKTSIKPEKENNEPKEIELDSKLQESQTVVVNNKEELNTNIKTEIINIVTDTLTTEEPCVNTCQITNESANNCKQETIGNNLDNGPKDTNTTTDVTLSKTATNIQVLNKTEDNHSSRSNPINVKDKPDGIDALVITAESINKTSDITITTTNAENCVQSNINTEIAGGIINNHNVDIDKPTPIKCVKLSTTPDKSDLLSGSEKSEKVVAKAVIKPDGSVNKSMLNNSQPGNMNKSMDKTNIDHKVSVEKSISNVVASEVNTKYTIPKKTQVLSNTPSGMQNSLIKATETRMFQHLNEKFTLTSLLHTGYYSKIYKCTNTKGENYAVKIIKAKFQSMAMYKDKIYKDLQKCNNKESSFFLEIIHSFNITGEWCFLTEYYPKTLAQVLNENKQCFHIDLVQTLSRQLVAAVATLANNLIVHTDINPRHILLNSNNTRLNLCGFDRSEYVYQLRTLPSLGISSYRAPEIILGYKADNKIDVWSTALIMYEMATGLQLFPGRYNNDILFKQICTLGPIDFDMLGKCTFRHNHFMGYQFRRQVGAKQWVICKPANRQSERLRDILFSSYYKNWKPKRTQWEVTKDLDKIEMLHTLLRQMLQVHPKFRLHIAFVQSSEFIVYEYDNYFDN